jgi:hypothetical protein
MVTSFIGGVKGVFMVNEADPKRACAEVLRYTRGTWAEALTPLSDETLAYHDVQPNEPWQCFSMNGNKDDVIGLGYGIAQTAFNDSNITDVGRGELRLT